MSLRLLFALSLAAPSLAAQENVPVATVTSAPFTRAIRFDVNDPQASFEYALGRDLVLKVTRAVDAQGRHFGWDFTVTDRRLPNSPNYFYECLCGHGPRPHDLYAWHFAEKYYPAERNLPVYGYPFEVLVSCEACRVTAGAGTEITFSTGTIDVRWRRIPEANAPQLRGLPQPRP